MWTKIRLRSVWAIVPLYLVSAHPTVPLLLAGLGIALAGVLVRAWAAGAIRKNQVLTTHGPYAFTRNPLYLGSFLIGLGFGVASGVLWIFALLLVFFVVVYGRTMRKEERRLAALFGEEFERYATTVPRFVPRAAPWSDVIGATSPARPSAHPAEVAGGIALDAAPPAARPFFQLRRYFAHREYQTLLGIGILFLVLAAKLAF